MKKIKIECFCIRINREITQEDIEKVVWRSMSKEKLVFRDRPVVSLCYRRFAEAVNLSGHVSNPAATHVHQFFNNSCQF